MPAQMLQLEELRWTVGVLKDMMVKYQLGAEADRIIQQMNGIQSRIDRVGSIDTRFRGDEYDTLTPDQVLALQAEMREERLAIDEEIAVLRRELSSSEDAHGALNDALNLIMSSENEFQATQAVFVNQSAEQALQWRGTALDFLDKKHDEIAKFHDAHEDSANRALKKCILTGEC